VNIDLIFNNTKYDTKCLQISKNNIIVDCNDHKHSMHIRILSDNGYLLNVNGANHVAYSKQGLFIYIYMYIFMCLFNICIYMYIYIYTYIHIYIYIYLFMCVYAYIHTYIHIYKYIYIESDGSVRMILDGHTCIFTPEYDPTRLISSGAGKLARLLCPDGSHLNKGIYVCYIYTI
jgi:hypothetical protein